MSLRSPSAAQCVSDPIWRASTGIGSECVNDQLDLSTRAVQLTVSITITVNVKANMLGMYQYVRVAKTAIRDSDAGSFVAVVV